MHVSVPHIMRLYILFLLFITSNLTSFFLDLNSSLKVDSVKVGSQKLAYQHAANRLTITPPTALSNGQRLTLMVYYQGNPANTNGFGSFSFATHGTAKDPVIWSLSEPYGSSDWFPCKQTRLIHQPFP
jgi:aminopeptidase N